MQEEKSNSTSESAIDPIPDDNLNHLKYFILLISSFFLAQNISLIITREFPRALNIFDPVFGDVTFSIFFMVLLLGFARLIAEILPELNTTAMVPWYIPVVVGIVLSHPILVLMSGTKVQVTWLLLNIIEAGFLFSTIVETVLFIFASYLISMIQFRLPVLSGRFHRYFRYVGNDILILIFVFEIVYFLVTSFISGGFESIALTIPIRIILILLFYFSTDPIEPKDNAEQ